MTQRGVCTLRTLLHGQLQTPAIETYLQNPTQRSTATNAAVQIVYDRNADMTWQPKQQQECSNSVCWKLSAAAPGMRQLQLISDTRPQCNDCVMRNPRPGSRRAIATSLRALAGSLAGTLGIKSPIYVMLALWLEWLDSLTCKTSVMDSTVNFTAATQSGAHVS